MWTCAQIKGGDLETVNFEPIDSWVAGTEGKITYTLPSSIQPNSWHWIAFFRVSLFRDTITMMFSQNTYHSRKSTRASVNTCRTFGVRETRYAEGQGLISLLFQKIVYAFQVDTSLPT